MLFLRTTDYDTVRLVITDPGCYRPDVLADDSPSAEEFQVPRIRDWWYVMVFENGVKQGVFVFIPTEQANAVVIHSCLLPCCRGRRAIQAYREGIAWVWRMSEFERIIGHIPAYNKAAVWVAMQAGLKKVGVKRDAAIKNGEPVDHLVLEITKHV